MASLKTTLKRLEIDDHRALFLLFGFVGFLIFGYEIFNYSLSIDEELFYGNWSPAGWVEQGRPVMALIQWILPKMGDTPFLPTILFLAGLTAYSAAVSDLLETSFVQKIVFGIFVMTCPYWLHLAEFNTVSYGVGVVLLILSFCVPTYVSVRNSRLRTVVVGALIVAICMGSYQALFLLFLNSVIILQLSRGTSRTPTPMLPFLIELVLATVGGAILYVVLSKLTLIVTHKQLAYIDSYVRIQNLLAGDRESWRSVQHAAAYLLGGGHSYFSYGPLFAFFPILGLFTIIFKVCSQKANRLANSTYVFILVCSLSAFLFLTAGKIAERAVIANSAIIGFFASVAFGFSFLQKFAAWILLVIVFVSIWLSLWLFGLDRDVRQKDFIIAASMIEKMYSLGVPIDRDVPFVMIGYIAFDHSVPYQMVEIFGDSFFEHDGGNPMRVAKYLRRLSRLRLSPVDVSLTDEMNKKFATMKSWPSKDSISYDNGTVVLKLPQLR